MALLSISLLIVLGGQTRKGIKGMGGTIEDWDGAGREGNGKGKLY